MANKFFFLNGGSEAVFFQERAFLKSTGIEVIDFSMQDPRNDTSPFADLFVSTRAYNSQATIAAAIAAAVSLVHSREAVSRMRLLLQTHLPDLVHCHNIYHQLTPSIIGAAKSLGYPVLLTAHDYKMICPIYTRFRDGHCCSDCLEQGPWSVVRNRCHDNSRTKSLLLFLENAYHGLMHSYARVDLVLAPSDFMARSLAQGGLDASKIRVLRNGVDTTALRPSDADDGFFLFLGRLSYEKGLAVLGDATNLLGPRQRVVVQGDGPMRPSLEARYPHLQFVGHLDGDQRFDLARRAAAIVVPSIWYENCPMTVLEAMAMAKPVIASSIGGIPELLRNGTEGLLVPPGNAPALASAIEGLAMAPERRRELGRQARDRVEGCFALRHHNERLIALYSELLGDDLSRNGPHRNTSK